ncbi:cytochrome c-type biogenesis CcmF C-terminal domain-containing protein, partial [Vibrio parahaemolyticus]|nr:cytochrome c-type biogenesis CcmF C-terminal domain-containing protein [Vibrio parahaemolyticus]
VIITFGVLILRGEQLPRFKLQSLASQAYTAYIAKGLLVIATAIVFLGTFYPMVYQLLVLGNISVGAPYFNILTCPLSILALIALAFMPVLKWTKGAVPSGSTDIAISIALSIVSGIGFMFSVNVLHFEVLLTIILATWVIVAHLVMLFRCSNKRKLMPIVMAHIGFALAVSGAVFN